MDEAIKTSNNETANPWTIGGPQPGNHFKNGQLMDRTAWLAFVISLRKFQQKFKQNSANIIDNVCA